MKFKVHLAIVMLATAATAFAQDKQPDYVVSTGKLWEARIVFVQYGEITKDEKQPRRITLKGNTPSSAVVLGVKCTAFLDQDSSNSSQMVASIPSLFVEHRQMDKVAAAIEQSTIIGGPTFTEMSIFMIFGQGTGVYLSSLKARKGQSIQLLLGYELADEVRAVLHQSPTITVDYRNTEVRLPVPWQPEAPRK